MTTPAEIDALTAFLIDSARYFRGRPTHGEDTAHWANVANAENCEKTATTLRALYARAIKAEAERDAARAGAFEEAAKIAEDEAPVSQDMHSTQLADQCDLIAAMIRAAAQASAMKEKANED